MIGKSPKLLGIVEFVVLADVKLQSFAVQPDEKSEFLSTFVSTGQLIGLFSILFDDPNFLINFTDESSKSLLILHL